MAPRARWGGIVMTRRWLVYVATVILLASACGGVEPTSPSLDAIATFDVAGETFRVRLTTPGQLEAARAAQSRGRARIPNGRLAPGTQVNSGWSWHVEDVSSAEAAIELCDGRPSDVERQGVAFGDGRFCPWAATVVRIEVIGTPR